MQTLKKGGVVTKTYDNYFTRAQAHNLKLEGMTPGNRHRLLLLRVEVDSVTRGGSPEAKSNTQMASILSSLKLEENGFRIVADGKKMDLIYRKFYQRRNSYSVPFSDSDTSIDFILPLVIAPKTNSMVEKRYHVPSKELENLTLEVGLDFRCFDQTNDITAVGNATVTIYEIGDSLPGSDLGWNGRRIQIKSETWNQRNQLYRAKENAGMHLIFMEGRDGNSGNINAYSGPGSDKVIDDLSADEIDRMIAGGHEPYSYDQTQEVIGDPFIRNQEYLGTGGAADAKDYFCLDFRSFRDVILPLKLNFPDKTDDTEAIVVSSLPKAENVD